MGKDPFQLRRLHLLSRPPVPYDQIPHRACAPRLAGAGFYAPLVQLPRHRSKGHARKGHLLDCRSDLEREGIRRPDVSPCRLRAVESGIAEPDASELCLRHRRAGAFGDHRPLVFGHGGEDVNREPGRFRHIDRPEVHPAFHQVRDERHRAGKPVELGDQQRCLFAAAEIERPAKLGTIRPLAAFDLGEVARERPADPGKIPENCFALGVESEPGAPLSVGRNAVIGDEK